MKLGVPLTLKPMEAEAVDELPPAGGSWQYEPKVDGFRCIIFRDGDEVHLQSKNQRPLERYFPEIAAAAKALDRKRFVLDGELVIPGQPFDTLQARLNPAASRAERLSRETPAHYVAFDLLADSAGDALLDKPFGERRAALEAFFATIDRGAPFLLSKRPFRNQGGTSAERGWMAVPDVILDRCSKPCRRPHVDADHPRAA